MSSARLPLCVANGRYELGVLLGRGGMGEVFEAWDRKLERHVALKVVRSVQSSGHGINRARREARAVAALTHPTAVPIYDIGLLEDGRTFLVMERVHGIPLSEVPRPIGYEDLARWLIPVCEALHEAHQSSIVHRDIKPQNLLLVTDTGHTRLRLLDFGIARTLNSESEISMEGQFIGTARYSSPEQAESLDVWPSSDIYSLGVLMFELLTGRLPFDGDTAASILYQHVHRKAPDVRCVVSGIPGSLAVLVARCLQKDPSLRPPDASQVADELRRFLATLNSASVRRDGTSAEVEGRSSSEATRSNERRVGLASLEPPSPRVRRWYQLSPAGSRRVARDAFLSAAIMLFIVREPGAPVVAEAIASPPSSDTPDHAAQRLQADVTLAGRGGSATSTTDESTASSWVVPQPKPDSPGHPTSRLSWPDPKGRPISRNDSAARAVATTRHELSAHASRDRAPADASVRVRRELDVLHAHLESQRSTEQIRFELRRLTAGSP